ncbi:MAG: hypothetical protein JNK87_06460 [Bryobacterales bacterium]|nr:hypothetical protein [Bryobacterales bacterium]
MRTLAQFEASRRNGAASRGPATPEGKAASSQNAVKHALPAVALAKERLRVRDLQLSPEEENDYLELYDSYMLHYTPDTPLEAHLARKCATAEFLLARAQAIQHTLVDLQASASLDDLHQAFPGIDSTGALAGGFQTLNDRSTSFRNMDAHQSRLLRELSHYLERLEKLRRKRPEKEPHQANEPETSPEPEVSL